MKIYVLLLIYPFGFILLAVLPFIGAISRLYAIAQIATAAAEDDAFLINCPSKTMKYGHILPFSRSFALSSQALLSTLRERLTSFELY